MAITERTQRLKDACRYKHTREGEYVEEGIETCIERARLWTASFQATEGEPNAIRRAKALKHVLENMTIYIKEDEMIVGCQASEPHRLNLHPELCYYPLLDVLHSKYCPPEQKQELSEVLEYWQPRSLQKVCESVIPEEIRNIAVTNTIIEPPMYLWAYNSPNPDYEALLRDGLNLRIEKIKEKLAEARKKVFSDAPKKEHLDLIEKRNEWRAMLIAAEAVILWARRFSRLARILAEEFEADSKRRAELMKISEICYKVPAEPCDHLWEALQAHWFAFTICHSLERYAGGASFRYDVTFWPYYKKDVIDNTLLTRKDAQELAECHRLKYNEWGRIGSRALREAMAGANELLITTIGGVMPDGSDACSEWTDVLLDAAHSIRVNEPSLGFRWHPDSRPETIKRVHKCIASGLGYPSIKNDHVNTEQLTRWGASLEQARSWALVLCMSPGCTGSQGTRVRNPWSIIVPKCFELALSDGFDYSYSSMQLGPHSGDPKAFQSFDDVREAFRKQLRFAVELGQRLRNISRYYEARMIQQPFLSCLYDGCVERGLDAVAWDELPNPWFNIVSPIDAVDSLAAIKKLVFDEKKYTMPELVDALRADWEDCEEMRNDFWNAPKFGNDDDYVDDEARWAYNMFYEEGQRVENYSGGKPLPLGQSIAYFWVYGPRVGALPSGRYHGNALSDGGISPYIGCDTKGPTAVLKSVSKIDARTLKGNLLNQRLAPDIIAGEKGFQIWEAYMKTWFDLGIDHVQFNVVDNKTLRAAQKEPEKHTDVIVRVAGYSAMFVNLNSYSQESIISRTEHTL
ncbi:MAG: benzylsuccinate synthase subunit alpha [Deltaproteobacteria bacterium CG1_02_45_11]|nr:MAG: benzylsuccinate synthase subunit alpha [Deltaproteobacteria bacterium CG1_02_45_11]